MNMLAYLPALTREEAEQIYNETRSFEKGDITIRNWVVGITKQDIAFWNKERVIEAVTYWATFGLRWDKSRRIATLKKLGVDYGKPRS